MKQQSEYVKVRRADLERLLREVSEIANRKKAEHVIDSGDAYAYALGQSCGQARVMAYEIEGWLS